MAENERSTPSTGSTSAAKPVVCVFCGASPGLSPLHMTAARELGAALHARGAELVYGGGTAGIMGEVARTLVSLSGSGAVHGIIPEALIRYERDEGRQEGTAGGSAGASAAVVDEAKFGRTTVVPDMHTRKALMSKRVVEGGPGSGFVALSGGYGTAEELFEIITWNQLGIHSKPIVVFNVDGYYDGLLQWVRNAVRSGFISPANENIMVEARTAEEVVAALDVYKLSEGRFNLDWKAS